MMNGKKNQSIALCHTHHYSKENQEKKLIQKKVDRKITEKNGTKEEILKRKKRLKILLFDDAVYFSIVLLFLKKIPLTRKFKKG
jgi:hypothetical protein